MPHEIDLLLSCRDIIIEPLEAAVFIPHVNEIRTCKKHGEQKIIRVGVPYWIDDEDKEPITRVAGRYMTKGQ